MDFLDRGWWDIPDRSMEFMTKSERRDAALSPSSILWSIWTNSIEWDIFSRLIYIASNIEKAGLKPYGPKGRQYSDNHIEGSSIERYSQVV